MPPLEASWLVKACCVLHNRCIDWELRRMRPGKNKDPEHENKIQKLARRRFLAANQQLVDSDDDGDHDATQAREVTLDGILRRKLYIHKKLWRTATRNATCAPWPWSWQGSTGWCWSGAGPWPRTRCSGQPFQHGAMFKDTPQRGEARSCERSRSQSSYRVTVIPYL